MSDTWLRMSVRMTALLSVLGLVAACASVPTGGRVTAGKPAERAEPFDDPYVRMVPVRPGHDTAPPPVPWRRLAWVTWRQHRPTMISVPAVPALNGA